MRCIWCRSCKWLDQVRNLVGKFECEARRKGDWEINLQFHDSLIKIRIWCFFMFVTQVKEECGTDEVSPDVDGFIVQTEETLSAPCERIVVYIVESGIELFLLFLIQGFVMIMVIMGLSGRYIISLLIVDRWMSAISYIKSIWFWELYKSEFVFVS